MVAPVPADEADRGAEGGGFGSLGSVLRLLTLLWSAGMAAFPLTDNSFFTHLATGRIILDEGRVPSTDPYTYTASGEPWTVQSWLASVAYAGAERLGSDVGLRVLVLVVFGIAMTVLWELTRPAASLIGRLLIMALALLVVTQLWGERPYMIGVIGLGLVWLSLEGRVRPWLLVPFLWLWVNTHGSFVLALGLVAVVVAGSALDHRRATGTWATEPHDRQVALAVVGGTLLGAVGPVGPKLLWFPLTALTRSGVFAEIIEWRPPAFQSIGERSFVLLFACALLLVVRRPRFRLVLPAVIFGLAAMTAQRNVVMATVVLVAVAAHAAPEAGTLRSWHRPAGGRVAAVVLGALLAVATTSALVTPVHGFGGYPARALAWLDASGTEGRVAHQVLTGNLLEVLDGPRAAVFVDDRVDMLPETVFRDFLVLRDGGSAWSAVLDRHDIEVVVWERDSALQSLLGMSPAWRTAYADADWTVAVRRASGAFDAPGDD